MRLISTPKFIIKFRHKSSFDTYLNLNERGITVFHSYPVLKKRHVECYPELQTCRVRRVSA